MKTQIHGTTWLAFIGLFLAGVGGLVSTATAPLKSHYSSLTDHLSGGPVWTAFGQDVTATDIYWGYAYSAPLAMIFRALVVLFAVKAAPSVQYSRVFIMTNILGTSLLLLFLVQHLLIVGQLLVATSLVGFILTLIWCRPAQTTES